MVEAIILLNTTPGYEEKLVKILKEKQYVKDAKIVYGEYDIVLRVEVSNLSDLRRIVIDEIRKMQGVEKTVTLIVAF